MRLSWWVLCVTFATAAAFLSMNGTGSAAHPPRQAPQVGGDAGQAPPPWMQRRADATDAPLAPPRPFSVVAFGDSVPAGYACSCTSFVTQYAAARAASGGTTPVVTNLAVNGETSAQARDLVGTPAAASAVRSADAVLVMVGANDFAGPFQQDLSGQCPPGSCYQAAANQLAHNIGVILSRLRAELPGRGKVYVLGYWDVVEDGRVGASDYGHAGLAASYRATLVANLVLQRAATAAGDTYISTRLIFRGPEGRGDATTLLAADGDHPNAAGHARIAAALLAAG